MLSKDNAHTMRNKLLVFSAAFLTGLVYIYSVYTGYIERSFAVYRGILDQTATSPNRYRVLFHYTLDFFSPSAKDNIYTYVTVSGVAGFLLVVLFVALFYFWTRSISRQQTAMLATFALCALMMAMFQSVWVIYDTPQIVEAILIIATLLLLHKQPFAWRWLILIVLIFACLNRATGGMVALLYVVYRLTESRKDFLWSVIYGVVSLGVLAALRFSLGYAPAETPAFSGTLYILTVDPADAILWNAALLPIFIIAFSNYRTVPLLIKRALWLVPLYTFAILWRAEINEIGLWLTIMPFLIPAAIWHLEILKDEEQEADALTQDA